MDQIPQVENSKLAQHRAPQRNGSGVLTLPSQVSDGFLTYNVTEISDRAFSDWAGIFGVTIPGTVRRVGNQAFYRGTPGTGLSSLTIEPGVDLTIGPMAFADKKNKGTAPAKIAR